VCSGALVFVANFLFAINHFLNRINENVSLPVILGQQRTHLGCGNNRHSGGF
jgi:hypothetical protein